MQVKMYVIYDVKAKFYNKPFYMANDQIALRAFTDLANDESTDVSKHPEDFILFHIGEYDDSNASIKSHEPHVLARAHELKEVQQKQETEKTINQIKENDL